MFILADSQQGSILYLDNREAFHATSRDTPELSQPHSSQEAPLCRISHDMKQFEIMIGPLIFKMQKY